jgi:hypothetical protein
MPCRFESSLSAWCAGVLIVSVAHAAVGGLVVNYSVATTGQTATADYSFADPETLVVLLTETTPGAASLLSGGGAVLTALGFPLPAGAVTGGTVQIGPGSVSVGFDVVNPQLGAGADVSAEWGYSSLSRQEALRAQGRALLNASDALSLEALNFDAQANQELNNAKNERDAAAALLSGNPTEEEKKDAQTLLSMAIQDELEAKAYQLQAKAARDKGG